MLDGEDDDKAAVKWEKKKIPQHNGHLVPATVMISYSGRHQKRFFLKM